MFKWLAENPVFADQYARAMEIRKDVLFDEIQDIADTTQMGVKTTRKGEGDSATVETTEGDMIEHRKLRIESRKWMLGKLEPKKYGDRAEVDLSGTTKIVVTGGLPSLPETK